MIVSPALEEKKTLISHFGFDLIRSISVNHRVSYEDSDIQSMFFLNLTTAPPAPISNPLTIFPIYPHDGALLKAMPISTLLHFSPFLADTL